MESDLKSLLLLGIYTCGQRPFELAHSQKSLYDADNNKLTISKEFAKLNRNNVIYIYESAKKILEEQAKKYPDSDFFFPNKNYEKQLKVYTAKIKKRSS